MPPDGVRGRGPRPQSQIPPQPDTMEVQLYVKVSERKTIGSGRLTFDRRDAWSMLIEKVKAVINAMPDAASKVDARWNELPFDMRIRPSDKVPQVDWIAIKEGTYLDAFSASWKRSNLVYDVLERVPDNCWKVVIFVATPGAALNAPLPRATSVRRRAAIDIVNLLSAEHAP